MSIQSLLEIAVKASGQINFDAECIAAFAGCAVENLDLCFCTWDPDDA